MNKQIEFKCPVDWEIKYIRRILKKALKNGRITYMTKEMVGFEVDQIEEKIKSLLFPEKKVCEDSGACKKCGNNEWDSVYYCRHCENIEDDIGVYSGKIEGE